MQNVILATAFLLSLFSNSVLAEPLFSTSETDIGTLMDNPQSMGILQKYIPQNLADPQFELSRMYTLIFVKAHDQHGELTDETLKRIDQELATLLSESATKQ